MEAAPNDVKHLKLKLTNPAGNKNIEYKFLENTNVGYIILDVIRLARQQFPELDCLLSETVLRRYDITKHSSLNTLCAYFNRSIRHLFYNMAYPLDSTANKSFLKNIFRIVVKEKQLPKEIFNDKNFENICKIFETLKLTESDVICNVGTGIGEIILQVASYMTPCSQIVGVTERCIPEHFKAFHADFQQYVDWFGKKNRKIQFIWPDYFLTSQFINQINASTVVFLEEPTGIEREKLIKLISMLNENTKIYSTSLILEMVNSQGLQTLESSNELFPFIFLKNCIEPAKEGSNSRSENGKTKIVSVNIEHNFQQKANVQNKNSCELPINNTGNNNQLKDNCDSSQHIYTTDLKNDVELNSDFIGVQTRRGWAEWYCNKNDFQLNNVGKIRDANLEQKVQQTNSHSRKNRYKKTQITKFARTNKFKDKLENCNFIQEDLDEEPRITGIPVDVYEKMYTILYKKVEFFSIKYPTFLLKGNDQPNESSNNYFNSETLENMTEQGEICNEKIILVDQN